MAQDNPPQYRRELTPFERVLRRRAQRLEQVHTAEQKNLDILRQATAHQQNQEKLFSFGIDHDIARTLTGAFNRMGGTTVEGTGSATRDIFGENAVSQFLEEQGRDITRRGDEILAGRDFDTLKAMQDSTPSGDLFSEGDFSLGNNPSAEGYGYHLLGIFGEFAPQVATMALRSPKIAATLTAAIGGAQAGTGQRKEAYDYVMGRSERELKSESGLYLDLRNQGLDHESAQKELAEVAARTAFWTGAAIGGAGGAATSYILRGVPKQLAGKGPGRVATSFAEEASQEVLESVASRAASNYTAGLDRDVDEGTFADALLGGLFGGTLAVPGATLETVGLGAQAVKDRADKKRAELQESQEQAEARKATIQQIAETGDISALVDPTSESYDPLTALKGLEGRLARNDLSEEDRTQTLKAADQAVLDLEERLALLEQGEKTYSPEGKEQLLAEKARLENDLADLDPASDEGKAAQEQLQTVNGQLEVHDNPRAIQGILQHIAKQKADLAQRLPEVRDLRKSLDTIQPAQDPDVQGTAGPTAEATTESPDTAPTEDTEPDTPIKMVRLAMASPERVSAADARNLAQQKDSGLSQRARRYLSRFARSKDTEAALQEAYDSSPSQVHDDILRGNRKRGMMGIVDRRAAIANALLNNRAGQATTHLNNMRAFMVRQRNKLQAAEDALSRFAERGEQVIVPRDNGQWDIYDKEDAPDNAANALEVSPRTRKIMDLMRQEVAALEAADAELTDMIATFPELSAAEAQAQAEAAAAQVKPAPQAAEPSPNTNNNTNNTNTPAPTPTQETAPVERAGSVLDQMLAIAYAGGDLRGALVQLSPEQKTELKEQLGFAPDAKVGLNTVEQAIQERAYEEIPSDVAEPPQSTESPAEPESGPTEAPTEAPTEEPVQEPVLDREALLAREAELQAIGLIDRSKDEDQELADIQEQLQDLPDPVETTTEEGVDTGAAEENATDENSPEVNHTAEPQTETRPDEGRLATFQGEAPKGRLKSLKDFLQANLVQRYFKQSLGEATDSRKQRPLVAIKDLLSKLTQAPALIESFAPEGYLDDVVPDGSDRTSRRDAWTHVLEILPQWNTVLAKIMAVPLAQEFSYKNLAQQLRGIGAETTEENLLTAITAAALGYVQNQGNSPVRRTMGEVKALLGMEPRSYLRHDIKSTLDTAGDLQSLVARDIGRSVMQALGIKPEANAPANLVEQLEQSLGVYGMMLLEKQGLAETHEIPVPHFRAFQINELPDPDLQITGATPRLKFWRLKHEVDQETEAKRRRRSASRRRNAQANPALKFIPAVEAVAAPLKGHGGMLPALLGTTKPNKDPRNEHDPLESIRTKTGMPGPREAIDLVNKRMSKPWTVRTDGFLEFWDQLGWIQTAIGGAKTEQEAVHEDRRASEDSKREGLEREINLFKEWFNNPLSNTRKFFLREVMWLQQRMGLETNTVNPQTGKIARQLIAQHGWETVVSGDIADASHQAFRLAVAQGLGIKIDQREPQEALKAVSRILDAEPGDPGLNDKEALLRDAIEVIVQNRLTGQPLTNEDRQLLLEATKVAGEDYHSLSALHAAAKMIAAQGEAFATQLSIEVDGLTNGPILTELQLGAANSVQEMMDLINRGGMFGEGNITNNAQWKALGPDQHDLYQRLAAGVEGELRELDHEEGIENLPTATRGILMLLGVIHPRIQLDDKGRIVHKSYPIDVGRNVVKTMVTQYHFGSGLGTIVNGLAEQAVDALYQRIEDAANLGAENQDDIRPIIHLLNALVPEGMPNPDDPDGPLIPIPLETSAQALLAMPLSRYVTALEFEMRGTEEEPSIIAGIFTRPLAEQFAAFGEARDALTSAQNMAFDLFNAVYELERENFIEELTAKGELFEKGTRDGAARVMTLSAIQEAELMRRVEAIVPKVHTPMSLREPADENGQIPHTGLLGAKRPRKVDQGDQPELAQTVTAAPGSGLSSKTVYGQESRYEPPGVALTVTAIHSLDSAISLRASQQVNALNVHDALIPGVSDAQKAAKALNQATYEVLVEYSVAREQVDSLVRVIDGFLALPKHVQQHPALQQHLQRTLARHTPQGWKGSVSVGVRRQFQKIIQQRMHSDRIRLETLAQLHHMNQYALPGGEYAITEEDRAKARAELEKLPQEQRRLNEAAARLGQVLDIVYAAEQSPTDSQVPPIVQRAIKAYDKHGIDALRQGQADNKRALKEALGLPPNAAFSKVAERLEEAKVTLREEQEASQARADLYRSKLEKLSPERLQQGIQGYIGGILRAIRDKRLNLDSAILKQIGELRRLERRVTLTGKLPEKLPVSTRQLWQALKQSGLRGRSVKYAPRPVLVQLMRNLLEQYQNRLNDPESKQLFAHLQAIHKVMTQRGKDRPRTLEEAYDRIHSDDTSQYLGPLDRRKVEALLERYYRANRDTAWGRKGVSWVESDPELVRFLQTNSNMTVGKLLAEVDTRSRREAKARVSTRGGQANGLTAKGEHFSYYSKLARMILAGVDKDIPVRFVNPDTPADPTMTEDQRQAFAYFDPPDPNVAGKERGLLVIKSPEFENSSVTLDTMLHESLHAMLAYQLAVVRAGKGSKAANALVNDLTKVAEAARAYVNSDQMPAGYHKQLYQAILGTDSLKADAVDELISWGMTDQGFQEMLSNVRVKDVKEPSGFTDALRAFVDGILKFLEALAPKGTFGDGNGLRLLLSHSSALMQEVAEQHRLGMETDNAALAELSTLSQTNVDPTESVDRMSSLDIFEALADPDTDPAVTDNLRDILEFIVNGAHGPFGAKVSAAEETLPRNTAEEFLEAIQDPDKAPFVSQVLASPVRMNQQQLFVLEQLEVTLQEGLPLAPEIYAEIREVYKAARAQVKPADLPGGQAEWDFIFRPVRANGESIPNFFSRFAALAMTHPELRKSLKFGLQTQQNQYASLWARLQSAILALLEQIRGWHLGIGANDTAVERMGKLARRLAQIQKKRRDAIKRHEASKIAAAEDKFDNLSAATRQKLGSIASHPFLTENRFAIVRAAGGVTSTIAKDRVPEVLNKLRDMRNNLFQGEKEGFWAYLVTEMRGEDGTNKGAHILARLANRFRQTRQAAKDVMRKSVLESFAPVDPKKTKRTSKEEQESLTRVLLRPDLSTLLASGELGPGQYDLAGLQRLIEDPRYLDQEINKLRRAIQGTKLNATYLINQAMYLGYDMVQHKDFSGHLMLNAHNIVHLHGVEGFGTRPDEALAQQQIQLVDRLASLYALTKTDAKDRGRTAEVMQREASRGDESGILNTLMTHDALKAEALETLFGGNPTQFMKGYTRDIHDPNVDVVFATEADHDVLIAQGYVRKSEALPVDPHDPTRKTVKSLRYIYVRNMGQAARIPGSLSITERAAAGSKIHNGLSSTLALKNAAINGRIQADRKPRIQQLFTQLQAPVPQDSNSEPQRYMTPVLDEYGRVTNYRYRMDAATRHTLLHRDDRLGEVLGSMAGHMVDKVSTRHHNKAILDGMRMHYLAESGQNPNGFTRVWPDSDDPEVREAWRLIPEESKQHIRNTWGGDFVYVRNDLYNLHFGYRKASIVDLFDKAARLKSRGTSGETTKLEEEGKFTRLIIGSLAKMSDDKRGTFRRYAGLAESGWMEMIQEVKDLIVIKSGLVLLGNISSNFTQLWWMGVPMKSLATGVVEGTMGAIRYQRDAKALLHLENQLKSRFLAQSPAQRDELEQQAAVLRQALQDNPVHDLMEAGLFQTIVEDVEADEDQFSFRKSLARKLDEKTAKVPAILRDGAKLAYVAHDTSLYKILHRSTALSDFAARYALYKHLRTHPKQGVGKAEALSKASEAFVNYDTPTSKQLQYLNDMGIVPFTKYYLRIFKTLMNAYRDNPGRAIGVGVLNEYAEWASTFMDSGIWNKGFNPMGIPDYFEGATETVPIQSAMTLLD